MAALQRLFEFSVIVLRTYLYTSGGSILKKALVYEPSDFC